jgi:signal transduction histidine kinase
MMEPSAVSTIPGVEAGMTEAEESSVRQHDMQRRKRLLTLFGAVFGGIVGLLFLLILLLVLTAPTRSPGAGISLTGIALLALIYGGVVVLARVERIEWSSRLFAIGAGIIPNLILLASAAAGSVNPFNVVFLMGAIVTVSLAGRPWMVLGTAALSSFTSIIMVMAPAPATTPAQAALHVYLASAARSTIPIMFIAYWGMALLLLAQWNSYQRLLLDLASMQVQVQRAHQLDEMKDQFIRSVNHELRTPIMTLLGYIDLLMMPEHRASPEKVERFVTRATRAGQALRRLLAGILDTKRLNTTQYEFIPESIDVMAMLEEVVPLLPVDSQNGQEIERALRVRLTPGVRIWAEPIQFQQILINLLSNAVKYSPPGAPVDIDVHIAIPSTPKRQGWMRRAETPAPVAEIVVRDYGLGIPPAQQPLLFQRFMRLPRDLESRVMGTGLGLFLCKSLTEQMGGTIHVESTGVPGEGTIFRVQLPLPPGEPVPSDTAAPPISVEHRTGPLLGDPVGF